jgi:type IV pilus assembly protein PilE
MIVVAVVAVLAMVAITSYQFAVVKSRRGAAKGCVMEGAQYMERYYTTKMTYNDIITPSPPVLPVCSTDVTTYYTVSFSGTPDATTFTVQAVPQGAQATSDTKCGTLTIDQAGVKGANNVAECW